MTTLSGLRDYHKDVADPRFRAAEESFMAACPWPYRDVRDEHLVWDIEVAIDGWWYRLDIKWDSYMKTSQRVAFEQAHRYRDGRVTDGWGVHPKLDLVAYVPDKGRLSRVYSVPAIRAFIAEYEWDRERRGWGTFGKSNWKPSGLYQTVGYALPMDQLEEFGALIAEVELDAKGIGDGVD